MAAVNNKRSVMILFSGENDLYSHRTRVVLAEKGVSVSITYVKPGETPEDLIQLNPYQTLPTLVDRDLVVYQSAIIMEYLDERFPHPPLLPVYPVAKAKLRVMLYRIENDWFSLVKIIENGTEQEADKARQQLEESLIAVLPVFKMQPYFLSDEFSLVDCSIAPLLWRLPQLGIKLPSHAKAIEAYQERVFSRDSFQASLTEIERELREELLLEMA